MIKPLKNLVYFKFIPFKNSLGLIIPDDLHQPDLRASKICMGQAIETGPDVITIKPGNYFLFHEYAIETADKFIKRKEYFIKEKEIIAVIDPKDSAFRKFLTK